MTSLGRRAALAAALGLAASSSAAGELAFQLHGGYLQLTHARRSAEALFGGSSGGPLAGAALRVDVSRSLFVRLGASHFTRTGERAFVADDSSETFPLGHPLELRLVPVYLDLGRRFRTGLGLHPYLGLGIGGVLYREESDVAGEIFTDERRKPSARAVLGAVWGEGGVQLGVELAFARTPDVIGLGGISKVYGESDLGGLSGVVTLAWQP